MAMIMCLSLIQISAFADGGNDYIDVDSYEGGGLKTHLTVNVVDDEGADLGTIDMGEIYRSGSTMSITLKEAQRSYYSISGVTLKEGRVSKWSQDFTQPYKVTFTWDSWGNNSDVMTVTLKKTPVSENETSTVTFHWNLSGQDDIYTTLAVPTQKSVSDAGLSMPDAPVEYSHSFLKWSTKSEKQLVNDSDYDFTADTKVVNDLDVYARWELAANASEFHVMDLDTKILNHLKTELGNQDLAISDIRAMDVKDSEGNNTTGYLDGNMNHADTADGQAYWHIQNRTVALGAVRPEKLTDLVITMADGQTISIPVSALTTNRVVGRDPAGTPKVIIEIRLKDEVPGPEAPDKPDTDALNELLNVEVDCDTHNVHTFTELLEDSYTIGSVTGNETDGYSCTVTIYSEKYVASYNSNESLAGHELAEGETSEKTVTLTYDAESNTWALPQEHSGTVQFKVACAAPDVECEKVILSKIWDDDGFENARPSSVTLTVTTTMDDNTTVKTVVTLNGTEDSVDGYTWSKAVQLPKGTHTVAEDVTGYDMSVQFVEGTEEISGGVKAEDVVAINSCKDKTLRLPESGFMIIKLTAGGNNVILWTKTELTNEQQTQLLASAKNGVQGSTVKTYYSGDEGFRDLIAEGYKGVSVSKDGDTVTLTFNNKSDWAKVVYGGYAHNTIPATAPQLLVTNTYVEPVAKSHPYTVVYEYYVGTSFEVRQTILDQMYVNQEQLPTLAQIFETAPATSNANNHSYTKGTDTGDAVQTGTWAGDDLVYTVKYYRQPVIESKNTAVLYYLRTENAPQYGFTIANPNAASETLDYTAQSNCVFLGTENVAKDLIPLENVGTGDDPAGRDAQVRAWHTQYNLHLFSTLSAAAVKSGLDNNQGKLTQEQRDSVTVLGAALDNVLTDTSGEYSFYFDNVKVENEHDMNTYHVYVVVRANEKTSDNLTIKKVFNGITPSDDLIGNIYFVLQDEEGQAVKFTIDGNEMSQLPLSAFTKNSDESYTYELSDLPAGTYTILERGGGMAGYDWTPVFDDSDADENADGYQVVVGESYGDHGETVTVTNKYEGRVYTIIFDGGDLGSVKANSTTPDTEAYNGLNRLRWLGIYNQETEETNYSWSGGLLQYPAYRYDVYETGEQRARGVAGKMYDCVTAENDTQVPENASMKMYTFTYGDYLEYQNAMDSAGGKVTASAVADTGYVVTDSGTFYNGTTAFESLEKSVEYLNTIEPGDDGVRTVIYTPNYIKAGSQPTSYTVNHVYLDSNGNEIGRTTSTGIAGAVNDVISANDISKILSYNGGNYTYDSNSGAITLAADPGHNTITLYYVPASSGGGDEGGGSEGGGDGSVNILDPDVPTTDLPEEGIPTTNLPEEEVPTTDLPEEEVPLAEAPATGDSLILWIMAAAVSGTGLVWLTLSGRKRKEDDAQ